MEIQKLKAQLDDLDWTKEILSAGSIGLWMIEMNIQSNVKRLYANDVMLLLLGLEEHPEPEECFRFFAECIVDGHQDIVNQYIVQIIETGKMIEVQYPWNHPVWGRIFVRCSGKSYEQEGEWVRIKGCHQNINELEQLKNDNMQQIRQLRDVKKEQWRYDALFQSVLCGIVQYTLNEDGRIVFKNANREAIRIFGYAEDEFWKKDSWDPSQLSMDGEKDINRLKLGKLRTFEDKALLEYRIRCRDGSIRWTLGSVEIIMDIDNEMVYQGVYLDISQIKEAEEQNKVLSQQIKAEQEMLRISLEHTSIVEFYYDVRTRTGHIPERTRSMIGCGECYENMPVSFAKDFVDEAYASAFAELFECIQDGSGTSATEFKLKDKPYWHHVTLSAVSYDENKKPVMAVGIVEDISKQKEMEHALQDARSRDSLTGLYAKDAGLRMVKEFMANKPSEMVCGMMIFDMDDFQQINEEEGTVFADALLQEVADILKGESGEADIPIRLGGDEFMLFLKDCDKARATILGPKIAGLVRNLFANDTRNIRVSISVGMCVTEVTDDFNGLVHCTESTLQYVKAHGKGEAACFLDVSNEVGTRLTQLYTKKLLINEISQNNEYYPEDVIPFALDLLGKTKNLDDAVSLLLARIGKQFGMDRVSIVEVDLDYLSVTITHQWARNVADQLVGRCYYAAKDWFDWLISTYDENGVGAYPSGKSKRLMDGCLHAAIWNQGVYVGALAFETKSRGYDWSVLERKQIKELAKLISSFIMKARADTVSQAKTDFLSRMSHEIRTPMNAIIGMTTIAKAVIDDKQRTMECLDKIESANAYLLSLLNDILDMSRIESGKTDVNYVVTDIRNLLENLKTIMAPQAGEKHIRFVIRNEYQVNHPVLADKLRLNQVLVNIVGNALKFTEEKGFVELTVTPVKSDTGGITLSFSVKDTGIGINKEHFGTIFKAFEQADRNTTAKYGGTGLGLSISNHLVQMMGGVLEVESELGKGSKFHFALTCAYADVPGQAEPPAGHIDRIKYDFKGKRVLLGEDNELNREIAETLLTMNGFLVDCAEDGKQVVDMFLAREPEYYDVILTDIQMPNVDGLQAAKMIRTSGRKNSRTIPIIAMSANAFDGDTKKSIESGMNGHLVKPVEIDKMLDILAKCLG